MLAFASIEVTDIPYTRQPVAVGVYRYQPSGLSAYEFLPNVRVIGIRSRQGPDPGMARFRYVFDPADPNTDPVSFQDAMSVDSGLPNVVRNDDRIVVLATNPDGTPLPLFDGFAQVPELSLSPSQEMVTFAAFGVAIREWDTPIAGALWRNADTPTTIEDVETDIPTWFNPLGKPNATPDKADATDPFGNTFPTFLDPHVVRNPDVRRLWTLPMAVRYLCYRHNPDQTYVENPDGETIDSLLDCRTPKEGLTFDPGDPSTYTSSPIIVPDSLASGKPWPVALNDLLEPNGFGMIFRLDLDDSGNTVTRLEIFRKQDASAGDQKDLYLQLAGEPLDPAQTNLGIARLARDTSSVANAISVVSGLVSYEASFILAPGFSISAADATDANALSRFNKNDPSFSQVNRDLYRLYVFDETGEGHWDFKSSSLSTAATSLSSLFEDETDPPYVKRRRIPRAELFSTDANRKPLKARLAISTDYAGVKPGLWDGTGTWQTVLGGFELAKDRLGIWINVANPNAWNIGVPAQGAGMPYPSGVVKGVEDQALASGAHFSLRLTCVIEGDHDLSATADQRPSSPTSFRIVRRIDASDRYAKHIISGTSEFNASSNPVVVRDDTADADAEATARRLALEAGEVAGSVTIPRCTFAYRIGDKICSIQGRDLSLRTNAGAPTEEGEVFPAVVGIAWEFNNRQSTTLYLSDLRGERR